MTGVIKPSTAFFVTRIQTLEKKYERVLDLAEAMTDELTKG
jgi:hypothetical protein